MSYIIKQKLMLSDLAEINQRLHTVLLFEPEEDLRNIYSLYFVRHNFKVHICPRPEDIRTHIDAAYPHVIVLSTQYYSEHAKTLKLLREVRAYIPHAPLITIGLNNSHEELKSFVTAGITGHVDRRLTRPQDLVLIVNTFLYPKS